MKKAIPIIVFVITFIAVYLIMSFCIPGLLIKLEAPPMVYFVESLKSTMLFKSLISTVVAVLLSVGSVQIIKKTNLKG